MVVLGRPVVEIRHSVADGEDVLSPELRVVDFDPVFFEAKFRRVDLRLVVVVVPGRDQAPARDGRAANFDDVPIGSFERRLLRDVALREGRNVGIDRGAHDKTDPLGISGEVRIDDRDLVVVCGLAGARAEDRHHALGVGLGGLEIDLDVLELDVVFL